MKALPPNHCAAANPAIASRFQSTRPAGRVAELGSLGRERMDPMDHQTWAKEFALRKNSVAKLHAFHSQVKKIASTSVGRWHVEQVAGYLAMVLADNGDKKGATRSFQRLVRESHGEMMYHARSTRDKAEFVAELYEALGNKRKAKRWREDVADLDRFIASRLRRKAQSK